MDIIENQFFSKPRSHISLRNYVTSLLESGRIIEASFFCNQMLQETPKNKCANKLAFLLAIRRMDPSVLRYDEALANSSMENKERFILHCRYYFTFRNRGRLKDSLNAAMDEGLSDLESLNIVIESVLWVNDIFLTRKFISLYFTGKFKFLPQTEKEIKQISLTRLVEIFTSMSRHVHG